MRFISPKAKRAKRAKKAKKLHGVKSKMID